jgi:large subunit ribosomal protein L15e
VRALGSLRLCYPADNKLARTQEEALFAFVVFQTTKFINNPFPSQYSQRCGRSLPEFGGLKHNNGGYTMGYLKYVRQLWKKPKANAPELWRERLLAWRREPTTVRIERPTRLDRARSLGYRAKPGIIVVRQRVIRGGRMREQFKSGRRPKAMRRKKIVNLNYQQVAEQRAQKKFKNCEVLNSYWVMQDGKYYWYEIILVDKDHPQILKDKQLRFLAKKEHQGRVFRGLTSAGRKTRGLRRKGKGAEKVRPSNRAQKGRLK